jgi:hypothetical protein
MAEVWKPIKNYPGYEVSTNGRVKSFRRYPEGRILTERRDSWGYPQVLLAPNWKSMKVHLLVLETFLGPRPDGMQAMHLDDVPWHNNIENLVWGTQSENQLSRYDLERRARNRT